MISPTSEKPRGASGAATASRLRAATVMRQKAASFVVSAAALALLTGCPPARPASVFPSGAEALKSMKDTLACANGVQGEGKLDHFSDDGRIRGEILLFAINPARVRIDVVSPFGGMIYTLTSNGNNFQMLDFQQSQFLEGPASACNLARLTQVPVPGHVLVSLLRGEAALLVHQPQSPTITWDSGEGEYVVELKGSRDANQTVRLQVYEDDFKKPWNEQRVRVTGVTTRQRGVTLYSAKMSNHKMARRAKPRVDEDGIDPDIPPSGPICNAQIPRSIRVEVPNTGDDVIFQYKKVSFNPPIVDRAFHQDKPAGAKRLFVSCSDKKKP